MGKRHFLDGIYEKLAYLLPKRLIYWCVVRAGTYSSTHDYASTEMMKLTYYDVVSNWYDLTVRNN